MAITIYEKLLVCSLLVGLGDIRNTGTNFFKLYIAGLALEEGQHGHICRPTAWLQEIRDGPMYVP